MKTILTILISLVTIVGSVLGQETEPDYLCFKVTKGTKISLKRVIGNTYESVYKPNPKIQYTIDKETWKDLSLSKEITININCNVYFRGNNPDGISNIDNYVYFSVSKSFECSGNLMTLIDGVGEVTQIPNLHGCFNYLFSECPLTTAPKLPATTLIGSCYAYMFKNCTLLKTPPALPATTLAISCYKQMFAGCTSLEEAPKLPATTLASFCYESMFSSSAISIAPELPATQLEGGCYRSMFSNCNNLVAMPKIYATQFATSSCDRMFSYCENLSYISVNFNNWSSNSNDSEKWVNGVSSTGTFVCPRSLSKIYNVNRIPPTWKIKYIEDLHSITIPESSKPYITINKTIELDKGDKVSFSITDRTDEGLTATVTVQGTDIIETTQSGNDYTFTMPEEDVTISVIYSSTPINHTITTDEFSSADKTEASEGETVNVTFKDRAGYNLTSATYNGTELTITNNAAQFTMPAANVTIATLHTPIEYNITASEFVTVDKTKATINDQVSFTVADRTNDGYKLDKVLVNNTEFTGRSFNMADYLKDVTITAQYSKIAYTITTDDYSSTNKTTANVGDMVNVTFKNRDGYNLTSATYNGTELTITDKVAQFTMPAGNVTIATTYTPIEYKITAGEFVTVDKTKATINDQVSFTVADQTSNGYKLDKVLVNNTEFTETSFNMADYLKDVTITAQYSKIGYTITTDAYSSTNKTTANVGDVIDVTFKNRDGYNLTSATYNGTALTITNNAAQFTMPAANVTIATTHTPIEYNITAGEFVTVDKTKATINDQVSFTVADRTSNGYKLDKVLVNNTEFTGRSFNMADYLKDVTITAQYSKIAYTITTDAYSSTDKTTANVGDVVNVTFTNRAGYNLTSATYNGTELTITHNAAQFTMPAANVTIATTHTPIEYNITAGEYVTVDKTKATINDKVSFTVADRSSEGLLLEKVLVNNAVFSGFTIDMKNYLQNVEIKAVYAHNSYTITNDEYTTTDKASANEGDVVNVTFTNRVGYNLTSATYNGTPLNISNGTAQFTMPAANVTIATTHTPIEYKITAGEFVTVDKTKATINDQVSFTVADRTDDGYKLDNVLVNNTEFTGRSFNMADYLKDVTITAVYSKNSNPVVEYSITNDEFSTTDKASANEGDVITVTFTNRDGYNLTSATYNGSPLNITDNTAQFTMPEANVTIATTYKPIKNDKLLIVDDIIVEADGYCAGDVLRLSFKTTCKKGKYQIMFSERAKAEGFVDLDFADIEESERQTAMFDIPQSTNYGNYQGFIRVVDADGNEGAAFPFGFNIDYPNDIIETKYADLICVNNFSHNYVAYQWMKNGKEIAGANKQFYIDYPALNGVYNVIVTDKNGNKFKVCDFRAAELKTKSAPKPSVNVYPNPAQSMQPITIELVGVDNTEKWEIMLYTHSGALVQKIANAKTMNVVYLKSGIYTGVVVINGKKLTFKLIVND